MGYSHWIIEHKLGYNSKNTFLFKAVKVEEKDEFRVNWAAHLVS